MGCFATQINEPGASKGEMEAERLENEEERLQNEGYKLKSEIEKLKKETEELTKEAGGKLAQDVQDRLKKEEERLKQAEETLKQEEEKLKQEKKKFEERLKSLFSMIPTEIKLTVSSKGADTNWEGISTVSQFADAKGTIYLAYEKDADVIVYNTSTKKSLTLKKKGSIFGDVTVDGKGNFYLVTGEENKEKYDADKPKETLFISKFDSNGKSIGVIGDSYGKVPFVKGGCTMVVNGDYVAVGFTCDMYNGHQGGKDFIINAKEMKRVCPGQTFFYQSHCFAIRIIPYKDSFIFIGRGDCFSRGFFMRTMDIKEFHISDVNLFHFWVEKGAYAKYNESVLNKTFANMGGLVNIDGTNIAFVGTSVKSLSSNAKKEREKLFIQIFDPSDLFDLHRGKGYITSGTRKGLGGENGDTDVTDYGVQWLGVDDYDIYVKNPQIVSDGKGTAYILYEKESSKYEGIFIIKIDKSGNIIENEKLVSNEFRLNPSRMPLLIKDKINWIGDKDGNLCICSYKIC